MERINEFENSSGRLCGAEPSNRTEKRIKGFVDYKVGDMRKEACKTCKYQGMYPQCNYANLLNDDHKGCDRIQYIKE